MNVDKNVLLKYQHQVYTLFCNTYLNVPITYDIQVLKYLKSLKKTSMTDDDLKTFVDNVANAETDYMYKNPIVYENGGNTYDAFSQNNVTLSFIRELIKKMLTYGTEEKSNKTFIKNINLVNIQYPSSYDDQAMLCLQILYCIYNIDDVEEDTINNIASYFIKTRDISIKHKLNAILPIIPSKLIVDFLTSYVNKKGLITENDFLNDGKKRDLDNNINNSINHMLFKVDSNDDTIEKISADEKFIELFTSMSDEFLRTSNKPSEERNIKIMMQKLIRFDISHVCSFLKKIINNFKKGKDVCDNPLHTYITLNIFTIFNKFYSQECVNFIKLLKCIETYYSVYYNTPLSKCLYEDGLYPGNYNNSEASIPSLEDGSLKIDISASLKSSGLSIFDDHKSIKDTYFFRGFSSSLKNRIYKIIDNVNPNMMYNLYLNIFKRLAIADDDLKYDYLANHRFFDAHLLSNILLDGHNINEYIYNGHVDVNVRDENSSVIFKGINERFRSLSFSMILSNYVSKVSNNSTATLDNTVFKDIENHTLFESSNPNYSTGLSVDINQHDATFKLFDNDVFYINYDGRNAIVLKENQSLNDFNIVEWDNNGNYYTFNDLLIDILFIIFYEYPKSHWHNFLINYANLEYPKYTISLAEYVDDYSKEYRRSLDTMSNLMNGIAYAYYTKKNISNYVTDPDQNEDYVYGFEYLKPIFWNVRRRFKLDYFTNMLKTNNELYDNIVKCIDTYLDKIDCDEFTLNNIEKYTIRLFTHDDKLNKNLDINIQPVDKKRIPSDARKDIQYNIKQLIRLFRSVRFTKFTEETLFKHDLDESNTNRFKYALYADLLDYIDPKVMKEDDKLNDPNSSGIMKQMVNFAGVYNNYINSNFEYSLLTDIFAITYAMFKLKIDIDCYINLETYQKILNYFLKNPGSPSYLHQIYNDSIKPFIIQNITEVYDLYIHLLKNTAVVTNDQGIVKFMKKDFDKNENKDYLDYFNWFNEKVRLTHDDLSKVNYSAKTNKQLFYWYNNGEINDQVNTCTASKFDKTLENSLEYRHIRELDDQNKPFEYDLVSFYVVKIGDVRHIFPNDSHLVAYYRNAMNDYKRELKLQRILNGLEDSNISDYSALFDALKIIACCIFGQNDNNTTYKYLVSNSDILQKMYNTNRGITTPEKNKTIIDEYNYESSPFDSRRYAFKTRTMEFLNIFSAICNKYHDESYVSKVVNATNTFYPMTTDVKDQQLAEKFNSAFIKLFYIYNLNFTAVDTSTVIARSQKTKLDYISLRYINTPSVDSSVANNTYNFSQICNEKYDTKVNDNGPKTPKSVRYIYYKIFYYIYYILNIMSSNELYCNRYSLTTILSVIHMFFDPKWIENDYYKYISSKTYIVIKPELLDVSECISNMRIITAKLATTNMTVFTSMVDYIESFIKNCISICTIQDVMEYHTCNPNIQMISIEALSEACADDYEYIRSYIDTIAKLSNDTSIQKFIDTIAEVYNNNDKGDNQSMSSYHYNKTFIDDLTNACYEELDKGVSRKINIMTVLNKYYSQIFHNIKNYFKTMLNNIKKFEKSKDMQSCILQSYGIFNFKTLANRYDANKLISDNIIKNINGVINIINTNLIYNNNILDLEYTNKIILYNDGLFGGLYVNLLYNCLMENDRTYTYDFTNDTYNIFIDKYSFSEFYKQTKGVSDIDPDILSVFVDKFIYSFGDPVDHYPSANENMYEINRLNIQNDIRREGMTKGRIIQSPWSIFASLFKIDISAIGEIEINTPQELDFELNRLCNFLTTINYSKEIDNIKKVINIAEIDDDQIKHMFDVFICYLYCYVKYNISPKSTLTDIQQSNIRRFVINSEIFDNETISINKNAALELIKMIFGNNPEDNTEFINCCEKLLKMTRYYRSILQRIKSNVDVLYNKIYDEHELSACNSNSLAAYKMCTLCYIFTL